MKVHRLYCNFFSITIRTKILERDIRFKDFCAALKWPFIQIIDGVRITVLRLSQAESAITWITCDGNEICVSLRDEPSDYRGSPSQCPAGIINL